MHHSTPGIILLIAGAFTAVGCPPLSVWSYLAALLVGIGSSLVLDEFAMIFRLQDVYWTQEGQLSVNIVTLAGACVGLAAAVIGVTADYEVPQAQAVADQLASRSALTASSAPMKVPSGFGERGQM